jgi:hypothetical protein
MAWASALALAVDGASATASRRTPMIATRRRRRGRAPRRRPLGRDPREEQVLAIDARAASLEQLIEPRALGGRQLAIGERDAWSAPA